ncbi:MAG: sigma-70 family RNA polymerase sigma factor [Bacteroidetes bacterium]|nr:MAG: sigma-70 family RNA polymerase sigma factor [Bacteroidota bacterium]
MTDEELVKGCLAKTPTFQKLLFERFNRKMMGVCLRYAGRSEEAEDMLQNGFIRVFEKMDTFRGTGSLEGWIRKIMVNESLTYLRKNKAMQMNIDINDAKYSIPGNSHVGESMNEKDLLKMIQQLPAGFRTVFNMYAIEGYSHKEIAGQLGISEGTSKSQYSRAKTHLQNILQTELSPVEAGKLS